MTKLGALWATAAESMESDMRGRNLMRGIRSLATLGGVTIVVRDILRAAFIGVLTIPAITSTTAAQTAQEVVNFIFTNANFQFPDAFVAWRLNGDKHYDFYFSKCVVTGYYVSTIPALAATVRIDFNKLLANTAAYSSDSSFLHITMEGDPGAVELHLNREGATTWAEGQTYSLNKMDAVFNKSEVQMQRLINAFSYFIDTFCPGKRSPF
jgi:hypothetical protein